VIRCRGLTAYPVEIREDEVHFALFSGFRYLDSGSRGFMDGFYFFPKPSLSCFTIRSAVRLSSMDDEFFGYS
jgi:hypothetical protein